MNVRSKITVALVLMGICASNAFGSDASSQESGVRRHGPPPEAYTACEGKKAGDAAQFVSPRGETVTGTCAQEGERLVLRPDRSKDDSGGKRHGPPPEAYTACEGKKAGDAAQFVSPRGETVTGTCVQEGERLVLRPDRPKGNSEGKAKNASVGKSE
jgi:hypothetical protein